MGLGRLRARSGLPDRLSQRIGFVDTRREEVRERMRLVHQCLEIDVEHHTHRGLGIAIDHEHSVTPQRQIICEMLARRRFADAALEVLHGDHDGSFRGQFAHLDAQLLADRDQVLDCVKPASIGCRLGSGQSATRLRLGKRFRRSPEQFSGDGCPH